MLVRVKLHRDTFDHVIRIACPFTIKSERSAHLRPGRISILLLELLTRLDAEITTDHLKDALCRLTHQVFVRHFCVPSSTHGRYFPIILMHDTHVRRFAVALFHVLSHIPKYVIQVCLCGFLQLSAKPEPCCYTRFTDMTSLIIDQNTGTILIVDKVTNLMPKRPDRLPNKRRIDIVQRLSRAWRPFHDGQGNVITAAERIATAGYSGLLIQRCLNVQLADMLRKKLCHIAAHRRNRTCDCISHTRMHLLKAWVIPDCISKLCALFDLLSILIRI